MYSIHTSTENGFSFIELQNASKTTSAKICLEQGARLLELKFNDIYVIKEQPNFDYSISYASSILFPFASRIKNGKYAFQGSDYQFECNDGPNALHGLIFNKRFELFEPEESVDNCSATFNYYEKNKSKGFPFTYYFSVTYTLSENDLNVRVTVKNTDNNAFPFILGWHPYFNSDNLKESSFSFNSDKRVEFDENLITKEIVASKTPSIFKIEDKQLDDCFILNDNKVSFKTPSYKMEITSDSKRNYLQLYTPKDKSVIAIEPMTGISNSFNNKVGLKVLEPQQTYALNWNLKLIND